MRPCQDFEQSSGKRAKSWADGRPALQVGASVITIIMTCLLFSGPAAASPQKSSGNQGKVQSAAAKTLPANYAAGVAAYQQHHYNEAIAYFKVAATQENCGAHAWLYMAHCYYAQGQWKDAAETYRMVADAYPQSAAAPIAARYLAVLKAAGRGPSKPSTNSEPEPESAVADSRPLEERLEFVRPRITHPQLSQTSIRSVKAAIARLPASVKTILNRGQIRILLTPTMIDYVPEGEYQEQSGYEGGTLKSCPGLFSGTKIVLAERTVDEGSNEVNSVRSAESLEETLKHEAGHAIDACLGDFSTSEEFKHAYRLDKARIPDNLARKVRYYLQNEEAGWAEACAQLLAIIMGSNRDGNDDMVAAFPETMKILKSKVGI